MVRREIISSKGRTKEQIELVLPADLMPGALAIMTEVGARPPAQLHRRPCAAQRCLQHDPPAAASFHAATHVPRKGVASLSDMH